jgi:hypothetical protein
VGDWGPGLYENDYAADLRDDIQDMVRAPWDGARLVAWVLERYRSGDDPTDEWWDAQVWLVIADLFWLYGIDYPPAMEMGRRVIAEGADLAGYRRLGSGEERLKERAAVLDGLAARWRTPNPKPRPRRMLTRPEPFLLRVGDCLVYPLRQGEPRNVYVEPRQEDRFYGGPWTPDGWGAACVLARWYWYDVFARYLVAVLRYEGAAKPELADFTGLSILSYSTSNSGTHRGVDVVSVTRQHLRRMGVEVVGRLAISDGAVLWEFPPDKPPRTYDGGDLSSVAGIGDAHHTTATAINDPLACCLA